MIGMIGAMRVETDALKANMKNPKTRVISGISFVSGTICGQEVVVAQCGIGKVFAAICAQTMILEYHPDCIINTGVAGTLSDKLGILDLAVASGVVQHDMDTSALGDPVGLISGINQVELPASRTLAEKITASAHRLSYHTETGVIASGDAFINRKEKKEWIRDTFGAIACEMEGAAIGHVCYVAGVDFAVIRAISDNASGEADMEYPQMVALAAQRSQALLCDFLAHL